MPEPPSPLRRIAYAEGSPLIGPEGDPEGWKILPGLKIKGTLFNTKDVEVDCTVRVTPLLGEFKELTQLEMLAGHSKTGKSSLQ